MYKEYHRYYKLYKEKYGPKVAIFMMVGAFYELYDIENMDTGEMLCNVREVSDYLGLNLTEEPYTSKDKSFCFEGKYTSYKGGFPDYALHKWAGKLTSTGWTVVIVDQTAKDKKGKPGRCVSRILSPATHIENTLPSDTPYVVSIYFLPRSKTPLFGVGALDLTTGSTVTYHGESVGYSDTWTVSDLIQFLNIYNPKEIVVTWKDKEAPTESFFRKMIPMGSPKIHVRSSSISTELSRSEYFSKAFSIKSLLPPKTYLGLRSETEELALFYLLQFVEEHYPSMVKSLNRNEPWIPEAQLVCGNHALTQLQITDPYSETDTIVSLFDKCITSMGKRAIKERIIKPRTHPTEISRRLDEVTDYLTWPQDKVTLLEKELKYIPDLSRIHRKISCGTISTSNILELFKAYSSINSIIKNVIPNTFIQLPFNNTQVWDAYLKIFGTHFDREKVNIINDDTTPLNGEIYKEVQHKEAEISALHRLFKDLHSKFVNLSGGSPDNIKLSDRTKKVRNTVEPYGIKCVNSNVFNYLRSSKKLPEGTKFKELKVGGWIECTELKQLNIKLLRLREALRNLADIALVEACSCISEYGLKVWTDIEDWIKHIDCTQCIGRVSRHRSFVAPTILDNNKEGLLNIKQLRHPSVESSATRVAYVKHDVALNDSIKGWLVYGVNMSGKSTLMKAVGICVILAQAGCFVPCQSMTISPFKSIYTRILNNDDLINGLSSFAVEMIQMREIERNADEYALVLGDELCSGTESTSAQALVASGIEGLSLKNSKFIFATHLHGIPDILDTVGLNVKVCHIHVTRDPVSNKLIYDRSLRDGKGSEMYGLEVAQAMNLSQNFIERALKYRKIITDTKETVSIWNRDIIKRECEVCGSTLKLEAHHIKERSSAIDGKLDDGSHVNDKRNLIIICEKCHNAVHSHKLEIGNVTVTSDGPERIITPTKTIKKSKWTDNELKIISDTLDDHSTSSLKTIKMILFQKHSIEISETVLGKIRRGI